MWATLVGTAPGLLSIYCVNFSVGRSSYNSLLGFNKAKADGASWHANQRLVGDHIDGSFRMDIRYWNVIISGGVIKIAGDGDL